MRLNLTKHIYIHGHIYYIYIHTRNMVMSDENDHRVRTTTRAGWPQPLFMEEDYK